MSKEVKLRAEHAQQSAVENKDAHTAVLRWLNECTLIGDDLFVDAITAYESYNGWAVAWLATLDTRTFTAVMRELGFHTRKKRMADSGVVAIGFCGFSLNTAVPIMDDSEALDNVTDDSGLPQIYDELDPRIAPVVMLLRQHDVHTISSCDGGDGHAFDRPTVVMRLPSTDQTNTAVSIMAYTYAVWEILDRFGYYGFEVFPSVNEDGRVQYLTVRFNYSGADGYAIPLHEPRRASLSHATKTASMRPTYWQAIVWARYQAETHGRLAPRLYMAFMPKVMDIALRCFEDGYFDGEEANNRIEKLIFG